MVRESLLSNTSPPRDERMLCEHVKHHTPEHLSVSVSNPTSPPSYRTSEAEDKTGGRGLLKIAAKERKSSCALRAERISVQGRLQLAIIALLIC